jgi:hypothetical protein
VALGPYLPQLVVWVNSLLTPFSFSFVTYGSKLLFCGLLNLVRHPLAAPLSSKFKHKAIVNCHGHLTALRMSPAASLSHNLSHSLFQISLCKQYSLQCFTRLYIHAPLEMTMIYVTADLYVVCSLHLIFFELYRKAPK